VSQPAVLVELGAILVGLAVLSRLATRIGMPTIPLYLTAGLAFGKGGIVPLVTADEFVEIGAEIGLILLLFMLGLDYTAAELISTLRTQATLGAVNFGLNFTPGFIAGLLLGWDLPLGLVLGGVTYVSSSGIIAKVLSDHGWVGNRETPSVLSILVIEDLTMVLFLPVAAAFLVGHGGVGTFLPAVVGVIVVAAVIAGATKIEVGVSRLVFSRSDESLLLTILGLTILVAGAAQVFGISAAVAALLAGIILSGPAAEAAQGLLSPMRDLFAAMFFAFIGLSVDPASIPPVLAPALGLAIVGAASKFLTGWFGAARSDVGLRGRTRAGAVLIARGEFSIAIAGLAAAAGAPDELEALALSYVFVLAIAGPIFVRFADRVGESIVRRSARRRVDAA
jgi:monovalent cation:H+ antiporter-2, CPA2 family